MKVEGIPDGWELVRIGTPMLEEYYISMSGTICKCLIIPDGKAYAIIRKIEKPKQYRSFQNAAEFEPHRDRWVKQSYIDDSCEVGCFRVHRYDDKGVYDVGEHFTYQEMFDDGRQFDDGTPFGIKVQS